MIVDFCQNFFKICVFFVDIKKQRYYDKNCQNHNILISRHIIIQYVVFLYKGGKEENGKKYC